MLFYYFPLIFPIFHSVTWETGEYFQKTKVKILIITYNRSISVDFQLYLVAPIIFLVFYYSPRFGVFWNILMIALGVFICLAPRLIWDIPHFYEFPRLASIWDFRGALIQYYYRADPHFVSYAFGMFCGYLIRQKPDLYFGGRIGEMFVWLTTASLTFYSMYWLHEFADPHYAVTKTEILLYLTFSKLMYLCGWFWFFYACATGRGGII